MVFVVTVILAVSPVAVVMMMSRIPLPVAPDVTVALVPFSVMSVRFAAIPLPVVPDVTVVLVPFAVVSARYGWYRNRDLRECAGGREDRE